MGLSYEEGPDIEDDFHNFSALNIPKNHPARQMYDTFYIKSKTDEKFVLRTHTSPVQIRSLKKNKLPLKIFAPLETLFVYLKIAIFCRIVPRSKSENPQSLANFPFVKKPFPTWSPPGGGPALLSRGLSNAGPPFQNQRAQCSFRCQHVVTEKYTRRTSRCHQGIDTNQLSMRKSVGKLFRRSLLEGR